MASQDQHSNREILRRLELDVARRLDGLLHGDYRGLSAGHGSEPGETRQYAPGDDVRQIHWMSTARTGQPVVKHNVDNRRPFLGVLVDNQTTSMSAEQFEVALEAAASIAMSAIATVAPSRT